MHPQDAKKCKGGTDGSKEARSKKEDGEEGCKESGKEAGSEEKGEGQKETKPIVHEAHEDQRHPGKGRGKQTASENRGDQEIMAVYQEEQAAGFREQEEHQRGRKPEGSVRRKEDRQHVRDDQVGEQTSQLVC